MYKCKICSSNTNKIFTKSILNKYNVDYHKCENCGFIQTDEPFWLNEAYLNVITSLDLGILGRNIFLSNEVEKIVNICFNESKIFIDYAGGYGIFTRMMRDKGFNFYHHDIHCENLFAKHFEIIDSGVNYFDLVTAFEVLEHFSKPLEEIEKIFKLGNNFIFTTEIIPENFNSDWMYIAPETGQHVSFYTHKSLKIVAEKFGFNVYSKNDFIHIFTKKGLTYNQLNFDEKIKSNFFGLVKKKKSTNLLIKRESLLQRDYDYVKNILNNLEITH
jgi:2-polyprenyl-3-methyl-5-hydroxy-6-metoxy-1,4-benzoquinol methylase